MRNVQSFLPDKRWVQLPVEHCYLFDGDGNAFQRPDPKQKTNINQFLAVVQAASL